MIIAVAPHVLAELAFVIFAAAAASFGLVVMLRPLLSRYALARPNARSSHKIPTPQGGGIAVVAATLCVAAVALLATTGGDRGTLGQIGPLFAGVVVLSIAGTVDDIVVLRAGPKLLIQFLVVLAVVVSLPAEFRIVPVVPCWIERAGLLVAGLWFINLVNFMDGIDWMTVAEVAPITIGIAVIAFLGELSHTALVIAIALLGATLGFAPFNRPVARLFLGDVGSLPIGLILFWLLLELAGRGHVVAALILPLYYLADTTVTLFRRLARGERITQAHRTHFYQIATERGLSVPGVIARVFAVNLALVDFAITTVWARSRALDAAALVLAIGLVAGLLFVLQRGKG